MAPKFAPRNVGERVAVELRPHVDAGELFQDKKRKSGESHTITELSAHDLFGKRDGAVDATFLS